MDVNSAAGEGSGENEEEVSVTNRNWRTEILVILWQEAQSHCILSQVESGACKHEFGYLTEISKQHVEVWLDFSFCHLVKFESTVKIEERPVKCEPGDLDKYQIVMLYT